VLPDCFTLLTDFCLSRLPLIDTDQFTVRPDCSVWSNRYDRVVHDAHLVEGLTGLRLLGPNGQTSDPAADPKEFLQLLLLGFGIGSDLLNAIAALEATGALSGTAPLAITLCEQFPPSRDELHKLWSALGIRSALSTELIARWPTPSGSMHRLHLPFSQTGRRSVELTLAYGNAERSLAELSGPFDWVFFGTTAGGLSMHPGSQAGLAQLRRLSHGQTTIAGYANTDHMLKPLQQLGLDARIDAAGWLGSWRGLRHRSHDGNQAATNPEQRRSGATAIVLGAGIAGLSVARELSDMGLEVTVLEQGAQALLGGSAQPVLAGHLHFSSDDNPLARLTRAAQALQPRLNLTAPIGRLQLLPDSDATEAARLMIQQLGLPTELVRLVGAGEASEIAGLHLAQSALWQSSTRVLSPDMLGMHLPANVRLETGIVIQAMQRNRDEWVLFDQQGSVVARAQNIVLCTGSVPTIDGLTGPSSDHLLHTQGITTSIVAGQTTRLSDRLSGELRCILGGDHYACPLPDGSVLTGASYRPMPPGSAGLDVTLTEQDRQANINGWHKLTRSGSVDADTDMKVIGDYSGLRHTTPDHLPLIGSIVDRHAVRQRWEALHRDDRLSLPLLPGVFMAGGFGSRGVLWSALAAAVLRDLITGAQPPIERSLIAAIAPHRFLRKAIRRYRTPDACNMAAADPPNEGHATRTAHD